MSTVLNLISSKVVILFILLFIVIPFVASSQVFLYESTGRQYGLYGGYLLGSQSASFGKLDSVPSCCPNYTGGSGSGFAVGALANYKLTNSLVAGLRLGFSFLSSKMTSSSTTYIRIDNAPYTARFDYVMKSKVSDIGFEPTLTFYPISWLGLDVGARLGFVLQRDYEQYEELVDPANRGVFAETGRRRRNEYSGQVTEPSYTYGSLLVGLHAKAFRLGRYVEVWPELTYSFGMTNISTKVDWKNSYLRAGVSIVFDEKVAKIDTIRHRQTKIVVDTIQVKNFRVLRDTITIGRTIKTESNFYNAGILTTTEISMRHDTLFTRPAPEAYIAVNPKTISLKTRYITEAFPTLSMAFFEKNRSDISDFYVRVANRDEFSADSIRANAVEFHKNILNIIGSRMLADKASNLTIKGFADEASEGSSCELARARAEAVASYLRNVWGIDSRRLTLDVKAENCQPDDPTNSVSALGAEDNRRVEFASSSRELLVPVMRRHYSEITEIAPNQLDFSPIGSTIYGIRSWSMNAIQSGKKVFTIEKQAEPDLFSYKLDSESAAELSPETDLECYYEITDVMGKKSRDMKKVHIVNDSTHAELERFSLILFAFSSDELPREAKENIKKYLDGAGEDVEIRVTGYTDDLGSEEVNETLSQGRARNTADYIRKVHPSAKIISTEGVASKRFAPGIKSYSTAAERFLSRTVFIEIIKAKE